jgi:putative FmdB family regulatory protein
VSNQEKTSTTGIVWQRTLAAEDGFCGASFFPSSRVLVYNSPMPIFEYRCDDCDSRFETIVPREPDVVECPECSGVKTEKLISGFAVASPSSAPGAGEAGACPCGAPQRGMCSN